MKSYFFVPANNKSYLRKIPSIESSEIILEMEDGIPSYDIELAISYIENIEKKDVVWVRPNIDHLINNITLLEYLLRLGFKNIILPKIESENHFQKIAVILNNYKKLSIIILVESPKLLLDLEKILKSYKISGVAFGMHDFAKEFGVKPNFKLFSVYAKQILLLAKAYSVNYIDSPSMQLSDDSQNDFENELLEMKNLGADGKFIIHPKQLRWFNNISLYTEEEVLWAKMIRRNACIYDESINHNTIIINDEVIEKPHIQLAIKILEWYENRK